jgi:transposase InsO family protein
LIVNLTPPGPKGEIHAIVAVDPLTKWVEVGALTNKASATVATWFHENITCRYGPPGRVRTDHGTEFKGAFEVYLRSIGCTQVWIFSAHPRANGLVERYNKVIKEGLRKFVVAAGAKFTWCDFLGDIAAGLRMLPTRNGYPPFLLVFKQSPHWGAWGEHVGVGLPEVVDSHVDETLLG